MRAWLVLPLALLTMACGGDAPREDQETASRQGETPPATEAAVTETGSAAPARTPAADPPVAPPAAIAFQPDSSWAYLVKQMSFGPRVPGTAAHRACGDWMTSFLERVGGEVERDSWTYTDAEGRMWPLVNILARFGPEGGGRLLLLAHWDSRPWADQDPDPARRDQPVPGANDGASGVAVLLEIARCLQDASLPRGVDILLVDGEDMGTEGDLLSYCRGSQRFALQGVSQYRRAVLLDMVGDADLEIPMEANSVSYAPDVVDWVWGRAQELGATVFTTRRGRPTFDDHIPLLRAGLPAIDLIDFDYPAWHTTRDDLNAVSSRSLGEVGRVVLSLALRP